MVFEIRLADKNDTLTIVDILNKVTLNLQEKNINQWVYPWEYEKLNTEMENGNIYVLAVGQMIIGTFFLKDIGSNIISHANQLNNMYLYRIAILPEYQGKNIGLKIINFACEESRKSRKILYLDCWAGNEKLKSFYSKAGLHFCGDFPEENYMISVFSYK